MVAVTKLELISFRASDCVATIQGRCLIDEIRYLELGGHMHNMSCLGAVNFHYFILWSFKLGVSNWELGHWDFVLECAGHS